MFIVICSLNLNKEHQRSTADILNNVITGIVLFIIVITIIDALVIVVGSGWCDVYRDW